MPTGLAKIDDDELRDIVGTAVRTLFADLPNAEIFVLPETSFSYEDGEFVEVRLILEPGPEVLTPPQIAMLRRRLFEVFEARGDNRAPLLRLISKADFYQ